MSDINRNLFGKRKIYLVFVVSFIVVSQLLAILAIYLIVGSLSPRHTLHQRLPEELIASLSIHYDSGYRFLLFGEDNFGLISGYVPQNHLDNIKKRGLPINCSNSCQRNVAYSLTKSIAINPAVASSPDTRRINDSAKHEQSRCTARQVWGGSDNDPWHDVFCVSLKTGAFFYWYYIW